MEIGILLKEAREEKGFTLDNIQEKTKIQKRYLVAIEQNDFNALPGKFYARAFIREYAEAVDLDPEVVLSNFKVSDDTPEEEPIKYTRMDRTEKLNDNKASSIFSFIPTLIVILLIIAIVGVAVMYYQKSQADSDGETIKDDGTDEIVTHEGNDGTEPEADDVEEDTTDDKESNETEDESDETGADSEVEVLETGTGQSPLSTLEINNVGEEVIVQIETSNDTYLDVKDGNDKVYFGGLFTSDTSENEFDLSGQDEVYLNIGNATGVSIKINDTEIEFPIDPSESVHQKLSINLK